MISGRVLLRLVAASLALGACIVSPQPTPPEEPTLDAELISPGGPMDVSTHVRFLGEPGAVTPPEGNVVVTNLDTADAPLAAKVAADGSFEIIVPGISTDEFRVEIVGPGGGRSKPVDLVLSAGSATFEPGPRPLAECLLLEPSLSVSFDGAGDTKNLVVRNECPDELSFLAPRLRRGNAAFGFSNAAPFLLAPGGAATITVDVGAQADEQVDVLFVETTGAIRDRRPLTLFVIP
ncbi:hypothetical protein [Polyangium jinanense]|uniref:Carboxypeptidase regulatory-like domain-containing protein n=1 Tax=Polyangium jinanense TaxID=2829994 RepID=A0A9X3XD65_9BACT|nr:hypothetical protein [Polyangium jinanense]MDC3957415.1 hypothetical protein [Polyangium jinanense]MDC3988197.1 hypothetical protein [Polyangium jinanense]